MHSKRFWFTAWFTGKLIPIAAVSLAIAAASLTSCTNNSRPESDQQLKQQAARTTETLKQQSKEALADARVAAANAERKVNDISAGVKEGVKNGRSSNSAAIDINTATESELDSLPGISRAKAKQIIEHRPYRTSHQLVDRGLLTADQYAAISPQVTAR